MKAADLRKSILQYAVEGKLVPQNIHDEPASLLYDKIIKEKENLIKQGKIKKDKPLPPVTDDEIPYDIPENWKWVRLGEVCEINKNTLKNDTNPNYSFKYIDLSAVKTGQINIPDNNIIFIRYKHFGSFFKPVFLFLYFFIYRISTLQLFFWKFFN